MREISNTKSVQLNLQNFESPAAIDCQYVLTSPRSLKACKRAGIKPVELLHRSLTDIIEDLNTPLEVAHNIYEQHERDRQAKIAICQKIRNTIINEENKYTISHDKKSPLTLRKEQLNKENLLRATNTSKVLDNIIPGKDHNQNGSIKDEQISPSPGSLYSIKGSTVSPEFSSKSLPHKFHKSLEYCSSLSSGSISSLSSPRQCSSTLPLRKYEENSVTKIHNYSCKGKKVKRQGNKSSVPSCKDVDDIYRPKSGSKYHRRIADHFNRKPLNKTDKQDCSLKRFVEAKGNKPYTENKSKRKSQYMQLNKAKEDKRVSSSNVVCNKNSNDFNKESLKPGNTELKSNVKNNSCVNLKPHCSVERGSLQNLTTNRLNTNRRLHSSTSNLGVQPKKKEKSYRFLNVDKLKIPERDRRILETLALKKEQEKEYVEIAHRAHLAWEADLKKRREFEDQKKKKWQQLVEAKRRLESEENLLRMEEVKESLRRSQAVLEMNIQKRNERAEKMKRETEERKTLESIERKALESKRRAIVDANLKHMEIEAALHQQRLQGELEERLKRAEYVRRKEIESTHRRVACTNRSEEIRHHENVYDVTEERELIQRQKRTELEKKEDKARQHYINYLKHKERHIQQNRIDREMRLEMAKEMQRELDKGLEAWQDQVLLLQCSSLERAAVATNMSIENKRLQVECENLQRQLEHSNRLRRVKEFENMKSEITQNAIRSKEERMQHLQKQREKILQEGRAQALITADLRENLRRTLSPESFDRKVARAEIALKLGSRPVTASPTMMMTSHIHLG